MKGKYDEKWTNYKRGGRAIKARVYIGLNHIKDLKSNAKNNEDN